MALSFRRITPKGLYARSLLMTLLPTLIILTLMTIYYYNGHLRSVNARLVQAVARDIALIDETCRNDPANLSAQAVISQNLAIRFDCTFQPTGDDLFERRRFAYRHVVQSILQARLGQAVELGLGQSGRVLDIRVQFPDRVLRVRIDRKRALVVNGHIFIVWVVLFSLFMVVAALAFLRNHVRSILRLTEVTQRFGRGQDVSGYQPSGASEIRAAAEAVIEMGRRLTGFSEQRTAMLAAVSHDLRTPLTRLKLYLALQDQTEDVAAARADVEDMAAMLEEYLAFARGEELEQIETLNIVDLVREVGARFRQAKIDYGKMMPIEVTGRPLALRRAVANLVSNAVKYAEQVELSVLTDAHSVHICVDDDGEGIQPDAYEAALQPFVRLDDARTQNLAGTGLGLALSQDVARAHGGEVTLERSGLGGLRACLSVPR